MKTIKSKIENGKKYLLTSYKKIGIYENTDEAGMCEILIPNFDSNFVMIYTKNDFNVIINAIKADNEPEIEQAVIKSSDKENTVTEDFALKLIAIAANKEKLKDLS